MQQESRTRKTFLNARVNLIFYFLTLALSFFSRKIFLNILGADFVGLTTTLQNILNFLNLAELGIGTAVGYLLYKPLFENNQYRINEIISVFGYMYHRIGIFILIAGIVVSFLLPCIFYNIHFEQPIIFFAFYSYLASSLISYFINYRQTLLSADQKNYVVTAYFQSGNILKIVLQIIATFYTHNYYLWIAIELLCGILYSFVLNWKINKTYPWLQSDIRNGKILLKKYPEVTKKTKQVFVHKLASLIQFQSTPFLVYIFVSLQTVAFYGNYTMITEKLKALLANFLDSTSAGIGNLIAEGDKNKILRVYWELMAIRFFFAGVCIFSLYYLLPSFIELWLGKEYVQPQSVLISLLAIFALNVIRGTTDQFINGHGLFHDIWSPIAESLIFIVIAFIGGHYWGLTGILQGNIISLITIIYVWKPYFLFSQGFQISVGIYWLGFFKYILLSTIAILIFNKFHLWVKWEYTENNWLSFIGYSAYVGTSIASILFGCLIVGTKGMKDFVRRITKRN